jgi:lipopolysaccharide/colanic/teichoic acid biosynthesis glycosyltransferase
LGTGSRAESVEKQILGTFPDANIKKLECNNPKTLDFLKNHTPTDIFLADEKLSRDGVLSLIINDDIAHHSFRVISDTFKLVTGEVRLNDIDEIPSITPHNRPGMPYIGFKRLLDIIGAVIGIIAASPLWIVTVILIKLESDGPALIRQTRIGHDFKPFTLLKFRTMRPETLLYEKSPMRDDDERITKTGRILRRLSIDELPQLWNILKGDMSLVGPRPEMEFIVREYEPWQKTRLKAKPGLTGLWQILGRKDIPLHKNLEYDFYYVCNRSLALDAVIILKTVPAVLFGRGAY